MGSHGYSPENCVCTYIWYTDGIPSVYKYHISMSPRVFVGSLGYGVVVYEMQMHVSCIDDLH